MHLPYVNLGAGESAVSIVTGAIHTCALLANGAIKCWGFGNYGGLGNGDVQNRGDQPNEMGDNLLAIDLGVKQVAISIAAGLHSTCAILDGGALKCWGYNGEGRLGLGDSSNRGDYPGEMGNALPLVDVGVQQTVASAGLGFGQTCALTLAGLVKCWGYGPWLGVGSSDNRGDQPAEMGDVLPFVDLGVGVYGKAISAGAEHTCVLLNTSQVKCWGQNDYGQLGIGSIVDKGGKPGEMGDFLPLVSLGMGNVIVDVTAAARASCALLEGGLVKCWGYNEYGQLGLGDAQNRGDQPGEMGDALPMVELGGAATALARGPADYFHCAILTDGSVKCWGRNIHGQLGLGDTEDRGDQPGEMGDNLPRVKLFSSEW